MCVCICTDVYTYMHTCIHATQTCLSHQAAFSSTNYYTDLLLATKQRCRARRNTDIF